MRTLVLIDASVSLMLIAARLNDYKKRQSISEDSARKYVIASLMLIDSNYWMRGIGEARPIWLLDSKPYWRCDYSPSYKANRLKRDAEGNLLLQPNGQPIDYKIPEYAFVYEIFKTQEYNTLSAPKYEADDIAGAMVRMWKRKSNKKHRFNRLLLSTIDTDWAGLVDNDITWVSQKDFGQRIRGHLENFTWLWGKFNKQTKKDKALWVPPTNINQFHSNHIFEWKSAVGDKADNIKPGEPIWMVDLLSPHPDHDLTEDHDFVNNLKGCLFDYDYARPSDKYCREIVRYIDAGGVKLPLALLEWQKPEAHKYEPTRSD